MATKSTSTQTKRTSTSAKKVKAASDAAKNLEDLYKDGLKDIYWAEKNLLKALPKMEKNATHPELKKSIAQHIKETESQVQRLEKCFEELNLKPRAEKCDAMLGLIDEGKIS